MIFDFSNKEFINQYLSLFTMRFTYGSFNIENYEDLTNPKYAIGIYNNLEAMMTLLNSNKKQLFLNDIMEIADIVNRDIGYYNHGFRRTNVEINNAKFLPAPKEEVYSRMLGLVDSYYHVWDLLSDPFEREAMFHIQFIRIHPFEDGNGRVSRIILNYNLCMQDYAPVVISKDEREQYFKYIELEDVKGLAKFLKEKSEQEFETMLTLYHNVNQVEEDKQKVLVNLKK